MKEIDEIARRQWGLITHEQILNFISRKQLAVMKKKGQIIHVHRELYRMAGAPVTWQQNVAAALLALPHAIASYFTAARLHGLRVECDEMVHVTISPRHSHQRSNIKIHQSEVPEEHVDVQQRISCTSVERTIIDLAGELTRRQLAFVIDEAVIANKTTFVAIAEVLDVCGSKGRKGAKALRALLAERLPLAEGFDRGIELKVLKAAKRAKLQQPQTQHRVLTKYGPYYIDAAWPGCMIGAESAGYNVHTANRIRHTDDRRRRNELETLGWRILEFTHAMSVDEIAAVLKANVA